MAKSLKKCNLSFLKIKGYRFDADVSKNSLSKASKGNKTLACKIIRQKRYAIDEQRRLRKLCEIVHSNIVLIDSIELKDNLMFVFTPWMEEGNLLDFIRRNGMVQESMANLWFYQLVSAVKYLHAMDLAHGNLSCQSVMLSDKDVKISGSHHVRQCKSIKRINMSSTAYYLPPEINKDLSFDPKKADVYALGVILFIMLNASIPFSCIDNKAKLIDDQMHRRFSVRTSNIRKLSVDCQTMIHMLLEPDEKLRLDINTVAEMKWLSKFSENS